MSSRIHYSNCPVCDSTDIRNVLTAKDHTVSGETFVIAECSNCLLRFTQDVPDATAIVPYYRSDEYISHSNTSRCLVNRLYQYVREGTLKKPLRLISQLTALRTRTLLDIGSGTGAFVNEMTMHGWKTVGVEPDAGARSLAKELYNLELFDMHYLDELKENNCDAITLWHVLEHIHDLHGTVGRLKVLLKDKGRLFIAVPNYTAKDASIYKEYWAAYDVPRHLYHFSPGSMMQLIGKHGLRLLQCKPMLYDSYYISMLSSKYKHGKTNLFASVFNGFRSNLRAMGNVKKCSSIIYIIGK